MKKQKTALTMVEVLVSIALLTVMMAQLFSAFGLGNRIWDRNSNQLIRQREARNIASHLSRDIRGLTSMPSSIKLDTDGETLSLVKGAATITYALSVNGDERRLTRNGDTLGIYVDSVEFTVGSTSIDLDIRTSTNTSLSGDNTYRLETKVRRRNG